MSPAVSLSSGRRQRSSESPELQGRSVAGPAVHVATGRDQIRVRGTVQGSGRARGKGEQLSSIKQELSLFKSEFCLPSTT